MSSPMENASDVTEDNLVRASPSNATSNVSASRPNVCTPLNASPQSESNDPRPKSPEHQAHSEIESPIVKKQMEKIKVTSRSPNNRNQRSSMWPLLCCGSEQSLVSLIDGIDLKDFASPDSHFKASDFQGSSDEEEVASTPLSPFRKTFENGSFPSGGKSHQTVSRRKKKDKHVGKKKSWSLRFRSRWQPRWRVPQNQRSNSLRETSHQSIMAGCSGSYSVSGSSNTNKHSPRPRQVSTSSASTIFDLANVSDLDRLYPTEDIDDVRLRNRAEEIAFGIEIDANMLSRAFRPNLGVSGSMIDVLRRRNRLSSVNPDILQLPDSPVEDYSDFLMNSFMMQWQGARSNGGSGCLDGNIFKNMPQIHTQVDFIHCLVPDLAKITACSYYWGVMDRYEAERLLDNKPEGTFLLRDSAQEEFLFSVSFRRYNRSLHARVEQWNHRFSFDAHDPAVFSASSVCELMEHYKDSTLCMFFEPLLTRPLHRNFPFSLQHLSRAVICDQISYDHIRVLPLPNSLKQFLQMYHYKQKVRVRHFDGPDSEVSYCDPGVLNLM